MYARQIGKHGETIILRRAGIDDKSARAFVTDNAQDYVQAGDDVAQRGRRMAIVLADDVTAAGFPMPFRERQDRIVWGGGAHSNVVQRISTRRVAGVVIAYELELEGN